MVPAVSEVWRRQALHWNSWRDLIALWRRSPQIGHSKPSGQRQRNSASRQASSVPYCCSNSASLSPFWNCTELRATAIPLQTHWCSRFVLGRSQLRKPRNQEKECYPVRGQSALSLAPHRCELRNASKQSHSRNFRDRRFHPRQLSDNGSPSDRSADTAT